MNISQKRAFWQETETNKTEISDVSTMTVTRVSLATVDLKIIRISGRAKFQNGARSGGQCHKVAW